MKKPLIAIAVVIVIGLAWYFLSPAFRSIERDDTPPFDDGIKQVINLNTTLETSVQVISAEEAAELKKNQGL